MPPVPWQRALPFYGSEDDDNPLKPSPAPGPEADNSAIMRIADPVERANQIARALAAGISRTDLKVFTGSVLDCLLDRDR